MFLAIKYKLLYKEKVVIILSPFLGIIFYEFFYYIFKRDTTYFYKHLTVKYP